MRIVKLVRDNTVVRVYNCTHTEATRFPAPGSEARKLRSRETGLLPFADHDIGYAIEVCGCPEGDEIVLRLPADGDSVYVSENIVVDGRVYEKTLAAYHADRDGNIINGARARELAAEHEKMLNNNPEPVSQES